MKTLIIISPLCHAQIVILILFPLQFFSSKVYRDGVGEGNLAEVKESEIAQIDTVIETFTKSQGNPQLTNYSPTVTFIVVTKRIHTRLFQRTEKGVINPLPGTVLDHGCTTRDWYDFFLVSQSSCIGTVTPTHYHVLRDGSNLTPEQLQLFT